MGMPQDEVIHSINAEKSKNADGDGKTPVVDTAANAEGSNVTEPAVTSTPVAADAEGKAV